MALSMLHSTLAPSSKNMFFEVFLKDRGQKVPNWMLAKGMSARAVGQFLGRLPITYTKKNPIRQFVNHFYFFYMPLAIQNINGLKKDFKILYYLAASSNDIHETDYTTDKKKILKMIRSADSPEITFFRKVSEKLREEETPKEKTPKKKVVETSKGIEGEEMIPEYTSYRLS